MVHVGRAMLPELFKMHQCDPHDVYNMDETGLNYRGMPKRTLASQPRRGIKLAKDRVTVLICVNATGTHKLPLMVIGSAAKPRCFSNWNPLRDTNVLYESNKSSWMDRTKFNKYMQMFNSEAQSRGKTAWLIMDNSSTHGIPEGATACIWEAAGLRLRGFKMSNTNVVLIPPNTTSHIQPLDAGIIANSKVAVPPT